MTNPIQIPHNSAGCKHCTDGYIFLKVYTVRVVNGQKSLEVIGRTQQTMACPHCNGDAEWKTR